MSWNGIIPEVDEPLHGASGSTVAIILLFGCVTFTTVALSAKAWLLGDTLPIRSARSLRNRPQHRQPRFLEIFQLLYQCTILGGILLFTYMVEHHPIFPHSERSDFDCDYFWFCIIMLFVISGWTTWGRNDGKSDGEERLVEGKLKVVEEEEEEEAGETVEMASHRSGRSEMDSVLLEDEASRASSERRRRGGASLEEPASSSRKTRSKSKSDNEEESLASSSTKTDPHSTVLNHHQTKEWKGWMILSFLIYQYTNAGRNYSTSTSILSESGRNDVVEIVNFGRVLSTSFLFLTGYHHTFYFYTRQDYSAVRILRTLFRMNFLAFFLCLVHSNPYIFYYVAPLHSYFFLMTYGVLKLKSRECNYNRWKLRFKLFVLSGVIFLLWDMKFSGGSGETTGGLFSLLHLPFFTIGPVGILRGAPLGPMWEWYYRTTMDHWSAYFGIIFAVNAPIVNLFISKLQYAKVAKYLIGCAFIIAVSVWYNGPVKTATVYQYCRSHPYFAVFPILAYIYFRNWDKSTRQRSVAYFVQSGEIALEIYLLHHHIFLTSHGDTGLGEATILTLLPGWPKCNIIMVSMLFFIICRKAHSLTMYIRDVLLPPSPTSTSAYNNDVSTSLNQGRYLAILGMVVAAFYAVGISLERMNAMTSGSIIVVCMVGGVLLYQTILDMTWNEYCQKVYTHRSSHSRGPLSVVSKRSVASAAKKPPAPSDAASVSGVSISASVSAYFNASDDEGEDYPLNRNRNQNDNQDHDESDPEHIDSDYSDDDSDHDTADYYPSPSFRDDNLTTKISPLLISTIVLFLIGLLWHFTAVISSSKVQPLPSNCAYHVNRGKWIPLNLCNAFQRGVAYRQYGLIGGFDPYCPPPNNEDSGYSPVLVWAWDSNPPSSLCRFTPRDTSNMLSPLTDKTVVFIGDGMVKNLYHSFCRTLLADSTAGGHDATVPKHADITKYFDTTRVEYKWAPLAIDQLEKLKDYRSSFYRPSHGDAADAAGDYLPDLIVIGGGAWDRLHVWATDEDQESLHSTVLKLVQEMLNLKNKQAVPVVWMRPTTVNTKALNQEEKRLQMSEMAIQEMRELYRDWGVDDAASFVLDGTSFTNVRVAESFDGIHYPPEVYDAGVQILANAMDWLIPPPMYHRLPGFPAYPVPPPPSPGIMSNPSLGLMMICFALIGLFFFDGFLGFSYLATLVTSSRRTSFMPSELYEEAFWPLHRRWKLPLLGSGGGWYAIQSLLWGGGGRSGRGGEDEDDSSEKEAFIVRGADLELTEEVHNR